MSGMKEITVRKRSEIYKKGYIRNIHSQLIFLAKEYLEDNCQGGELR